MTHWFTGEEIDQLLKAAREEFRKAVAEAARETPMPDYMAEAFPNGIEEEGND